MRTTLARDPLLATGRVLVSAGLRSGDELADEYLDVRERIRAAAMGVSHVREIHNLSVIDTADGRQVSLHLKLPGDTSLVSAHEVAEQVERAIEAAVPEVVAVQTHIEPLAAGSAGAVVERDTAEVERIVLEATGAQPREVRFLNTGDGLVVFLTLGLSADVTLADAHASRALVLLGGDWNFPEAERELREAIRLDPEQALPRIYLAWVRVLRRDPSDGIA